MEGSCSRLDPSWPRGLVQHRCSADSCTCDTRAPGPAVCGPQRPPSSFHVTSHALCLRRADQVPWVGGDGTTVRLAWASREHTAAPLPTGAPGTRADPGLWGQSTASARGQDAAATAGLTGDTGTRPRWLTAGSTEQAPCQGAGDTDPCSVPDHAHAASLKGMEQDARPEVQAPPNRSAWRGRRGPLAVEAPAARLSQGTGSARAGSRHAPAEGRTRGRQPVPVPSVSTRRPHANPTKHLARPRPNVGSPHGERLRTCRSEPVAGHDA